MKLFALICLMLTMFGVGLTYTRGSLMVLLFISGLSLFSFRLVRWRHIPLILLAAALGLVLMSGNLGQRLATVAEAVPGHENSLHPDSSIELRWLFANTAVQMFADNPLTGVGSGNYSANYDPYADQAGSDARHYGDADEGHFAHNLFLETAAETGLTGLFLLGALFASALWSAQASAARVARQEPGLAISALALRNSALAYLLTGMLLHGHFQRPVFIVIGLIAALASFSAAPRNITDTAGAGS
jgi:O-antigen ligase